MTDKDINELIAESFGYKRIPPVPVEYMWRIGSITTGTGTWQNPKGEAILEDWLPNFAENLDAILKGIKNKGLSAEQKVKFLNSLRKTISDPNQKVSDFDLFMADARQVCQAYLVAIGEYKE